MTTPSGPITLTPAQFAKTPAAAKPGATYQSYQRFVNNRRAANPPTPPDPYSSIIAGLPKPLSNGQVQSEAQGEISPIVAAIVAAITKQDQGATSAITGYSNDAASKLAAINYGAPYSQGEGAQAAVDASLAQSLAGQGQSDAQGLQARLAAINDPSVAAAAANVSQNATGAANADTAQGSAALSNLIANAAAANSYGQQQPGIQRAAGLQDIAGVQQTGAANIASGTQAAEQQLPSILQSLTAENDNRSSAIASAKQNQLARNDNIVAGQNANTLAQQKIDTQQDQFIKTYNLKVTTLNDKNGQAATKAAAPDSTLSKTVGYLVDSSGNAIPKTGGGVYVLPGFKVQGGQVVKVGTAKTGSVSGLTPAQTQKYRGLAATIADNGLNGFTDAKGVVHPALTRDQAIQEAEKEGIPDSIALAYINKTYGAPGGKTIKQPAKKGDLGLTVSGANGQVVK